MTIDDLSKSKTGFSLADIIARNPVEYFNEVFALEITKEELAAYASQVLGPNYLNS